MSYRAILNKPVFSNASLASNLTSEPIFIGHLRSVAFAVDWNGTSPNGELVFEVTMDDVKNANGPVRWARIEFQNPVLINTNVGNHYVLIHDSPIRYIRVRYERTGGSGSLTINAASI